VQKSYYNQVTSGFQYLFVGWWRYECKAATKQIKSFVEPERKD